METDIILEADVTPAQVAELAQLAEGYGIRGIWTQTYASGRDPLSRTTARLPSARPGGNS